MPVALSLSKPSAAQPLAEAYATATALMVHNLMTPETADKRPPNWA